MNIVAHPFVLAMRDQNVARADYEDPSWAFWWVAHSAADAEPPPVVEVPHWEDIWNIIGGGRPWPTVRPREWHLYGSRRIAKTRENARRKAWSCVTHDGKRLTRGETGVANFYAPDRAQALIAFNYAASFIEESPLLARMIENRTRHEIRFTNSTLMRVATASFRTSRGFTSIGAHVDESAFLWDGESLANPIGELLTAIRPAMSTQPSAQLSTATTPRTRTGEVWNIFNRYFGKDDPRVLVLRADHTFNPTLDPAVVEAALEQDEQVARSEYFAEFRSDLETLLTREVVMPCVVPNRGDLPPTAGQRVLWFADPAGGSGADSYTLCGAAPAADGRVSIVALAERKPPFSPDDVTREFAEIIRRYGGSSVRGDKYAGEWPRERFRRHGVSYEVNQKTTSEIYQQAVPLLTGQRIELPDNARLIAQLCALERRLSPGGRTLITHPPRGHDDLANAALGAAVAAVASASPSVSVYRIDF
jgi:hypothetical protein